MNEVRRTNGRTNGRTDGRTDGRTRSNKKRTKSTGRKYSLRRYITVPSTILAIAAICMIVIALNLTMSTKTDAHERDPHAGEYKYYKSIEIQSGDTLWSIAQEYAPDDMTTKEYVDHLKAINGLSGDNITSGCHIIVSYYSEDLI